MLEQALRRGDVDGEERVRAVRERHVRLGEMDDRVDLGSVGQSGRRGRERVPLRLPGSAVDRARRRRLVPGAASARNQVRRDEPGRTGDEDLHACLGSSRQCRADLRRARSTLPSRAARFAFSLLPTRRLMRTRTSGWYCDVDVGADDLDHPLRDLSRGRLGAAADIELLAGDRGHHRGHVRVRDVGDVHEVERLAAVAGDRRRLARRVRGARRPSRGPLLTRAVDVHVAERHVRRAHWSLNERRKYSPAIFVAPYIVRAPSGWPRPWFRRCRRRPRTPTSRRPSRRRLLRRLEDVERADDVHVETESRLLDVGPSGSTAMWKTPSIPSIARADRVRRR